MSRVGLGAVALALCVSGVGCTERKMVPSANEEAATAAQAVVERGLASMERMDADGFGALCRPDVVGYDIDYVGKPVRMASREEAVGYVAGLTAEAKKAGATFKFENVRIKCRASGDQAYCLLEYDFVATTRDGNRMVQPTRTSVVLGRSEGTWKWEHWHSSLSAPPPPPPPPPARGRRTVTP